MNDKYIKADEKGITIDLDCKISDILAFDLPTGFNVLSDVIKNLDSEAKENFTLKEELLRKPACKYFRNEVSEKACLRRGGECCTGFINGDIELSLFGAAKDHLPHCEVACPIQSGISDYQEMIRKNNLEEAAKKLFETNPFGAITGRVCSQVCESMCSRGMLDEPVNIRNIERYLGDYILDNYTKFLGEQAEITGKRVAIIGSGPTGLTAAFYLKEKGHAVTIYEKDSKIGGSLRNLVPEFRLPEEILNKTIKILETIGVEFKCGESVDDTNGIGFYHANNHGVFIAYGANSIVPGREFLKAVKQNSYDVSNIIGKSVLIKGSDIFAIDGAIIAKRLGAQKVVISLKNNYNNIDNYLFEIKEAKSEGIIVLNENDVNENEYDISLEFDYIIDNSHFKNDISISPIGKILIDSNTCETNIGGVYAAGEATNLPQSIAHAIAMGEKAAIAMDKYLMRTRPLEKEAAYSELQEWKYGTFDHNCWNKMSKVEMITRPKADRTLDCEDAIGYDSEDTLKEAGRCFNCGCMTVNNSELSPALVALEGKFITSEGIVEAEKLLCDKLDIVRGEGPEILGIFLPYPNALSKLAYIKKDSISLVVNSYVKDGLIFKTKMVFGGVSSKPYRPRKAEFMLFRKPRNNDSAMLAVESVLNEIMPVWNNEFKKEIVKKLILDAFSV